MILAVHIGNTNITIGAVKGTEIIFQARLRTDVTKTSDEYAIDLKMLLAIHSVAASEIEGAIIASVVPQVLNQMKTGLKKLFGKPILVVGPGIKTGLNIRIDNPAQTGSDLVVGCVAALKLRTPPLIVVGMGTATTLMVLDKNGAMIGGSISPGVRISMEALTERAALLPGLQLDQPKRAIGRNTIECMRSGILNGAAAMLDGMIARMEEELGEKATVVVTGRIGQYVVPLCRTPMLYDRDLIIKGLAALYTENTRQKSESGGTQ
ncbi:type III pantothenate kinase [Pseudoflavonifractor sp. MSJ-30]|uniref:type III pantothenate kinase n=1 Tax=Pseudoflavonifractor sp. MSJ-30 TaxID=2841525 RepID=UPI001C10AF44|nr:type III pantothenate kinase [Pseudoflavonifractor sp. MSJ-30]MBU5452017.1 type III pantothenate kinase [Pseudoflavonifractor sp. MSJ-30]